MEHAVHRNSQRIIPLSEKRVFVIRPYRHFGSVKLPVIVFYNGVHIESLVKRERKLRLERAHVHPRVGRALNARKAFKFNLVAFEVKAPAAAAADGPYGYRMLSERQGNGKRILAVLYRIYFVFIDINGCRALGFYLKIINGAAHFVKEALRNAHCVFAGAQPVDTLKLPLCFELAVPFERGIQLRVHVGLAHAHFKIRLKIGCDGLCKDKALLSVALL